MINADQQIGQKSLGFTDKLCSCILHVYVLTPFREAMLTFVDSSMDPRIYEDEMSGQQIVRLLNIMYFIVFL